jgi:hypothetical protein
MMGQLVIVKMEMLSSLEIFPLNFFFLKDDLKERKGEDCCLTKMVLEHDIACLEQYA